MSGSAALPKVAGDQIHPKHPGDDGDNGPQRFHEGQTNAHKAGDSKDNRTIANRLAREEQRPDEEEERGGEEAAQSRRDPTLPARAHGNEPSKGAKVDAELQAEEEEELRRKGKA